MEMESLPNGDSSVIITTPSVPPRLNHIAESLKLEHQFLKVPFEHFKKNMRANHRIVEKEMNAVISSVAEAADKEMSKEEAVQHLTSLVSKLQGLKRKLEESNRSEQLQAQRCRARLDHLDGIEIENQSEWNGTRVKRILVDYMLRMTYYDTAMKLAKSSNIQIAQFRGKIGRFGDLTAQTAVGIMNPGYFLNPRFHYQEGFEFSDNIRSGVTKVIERLAPNVTFAIEATREDLVDIDVFLEAKKVIDALHGKEVAPALAWCADNKSRLKKSKSKFEFQLRLQEFIELVRAESSLRAIAYARKYLAPWGATHMKELQRVMATLAFKSNTECATYKVLFEANQWNYLVEQFKQEFCRLYGMTLESLLNIYLQAGLSALKTPFCYEKDCTKEDPLSQDSFRQLALPLPFSKQHHSKLVCFITKELMDADNPPLVFPNGYVYSTKALEEMARKNDGQVTCPRTGLICNFTELSKVFIS